MKSFIAMLAFFDILVAGAVVFGFADLTLAQAAFLITFEGVLVLIIAIPGGFK